MIKPQFSINAVNDDNESLLYRAIESRNKTILCLLLALGADVNQKTTHFNITPLQAAIMSDEPTAHMLLGDENIDINLQSDDGKNALHEAVIFKRSEQLIEKLIKKGIDINLQDSVGQTALNLALDDFRPNLTAAEILKKHGALENKEYKPVLIAHDAKSLIYN